MGDPTEERLADGAEAVAEEVFEAMVKKLQSESLKDREGWSYDNDAHPYYMVNSMGEMVEISIINIRVAEKKATLHFKIGDDARVEDKEVDLDFPNLNNARREMEVFIIEFLQKEGYLPK